MQAHSKFERWLASPGSAVADASSPGSAVAGASSPGSAVAGASSAIGHAIGEHPFGEGCTRKWDDGHEQMEVGRCCPLRPSPFEEDIAVAAPEKNAYGFQAQNIVDNAIANSLTQAIGHGIGALEAIGADQPAAEPSAPSCRQVPWPVALVGERERPPTRYVQICQFCDERFRYKCCNCGIRVCRKHAWYCQLICSKCNDTDQFQGLKV